MVRLRSMACFVVMAAGRAVLAARRSYDVAAPAEISALSLHDALPISTPRPEALAAMPVLWERAALVATLLADLAATAVTAATAGRLMAATRLVATAATDLCSALAETSPA